MNIHGTSINRKQAQGLILLVNKKWGEVAIQTRIALKRRGLTHQLQGANLPYVTTFGYQVLDDLLKRKYYNQFANETKPVIEPEHGSVAWLIAELQKLDPKAYVLVFSQPWDIEDLTDIDGYPVRNVERIQATASELGVPVSDMLLDTDIYPNGIVTLRLADSE